MLRFLRILSAAVALLLIPLAPIPASAAMAPAGLGQAADSATALPASEARWGGRGGVRGHRGFAPRRHGWGPRRHPGWGFYPGPRVGYYGCIRRGWVWNGYRHVWRRYRVC